MKDFKSIIDVLKIHISQSKEIKILDKDVAKLLNMSQARFATLKKRNAIPYRNLLHFCKEEDICCRDIFFD